MSARVARQTVSLFNAKASQVLSLPPGYFQVRSNGIEFHSPVRIAEWTEMTVEVETSAGGRSTRCAGVVVACRGNRHAGYRVCLLFTGLSAHDRNRLRAIALSTSTLGLQ